MSTRALSSLPRSTSTPGWPTWMLWLAASAIVLLVTTFVTIRYLPGDSEPPGPQTLALQQQMQRYIKASVDVFEQRFGSPSRLYKEVPGSELEVHEYRCPDGRLRVFVWVESRTVAAVYADGPQRRLGAAEEAGNAMRPIGSSRRTGSRCTSRAIDAMHRGNRRAVR